MYGEDRVRGRVVGQRSPINSWLDNAQEVLDYAGLVPVFGAIPDLINSGVSLLRGNPGRAAMSAFSAIPMIGDVTQGANLLGKIRRGVSRVVGGWRGFD